MTRFGIASDAVPSELRSAREFFDRHDYLRLPGFIEPKLLRVIHRRLASARFEKRGYEVGNDLTLADAKDPLALVLYLMMNDSKLFRLIRRITGCGPIGCFTGRLYQMVDQPGLDFTWHDDAFADRIVAISINLSDAPYRGGTLQIRRKSRRSAAAVPNLGFGDAIIFRISDHLEHRVAPIEGKTAKTALTGWFRSRPRYRRMHHALLARSENKLGSRNGGNRRDPVLPSDIARPPDRVVSQKAGRETFVADIETGMCYGLNQSGGRIWELMAQSRSMRAVSIMVAAEYGAPPRQVERDVLALAHQLAQRHLVRIVHTAR